MRLIEHAATLGAADEAFIARVPASWLPLVPVYRFAEGSHFDGRPMAGLVIRELTSTAQIVAQSILTPQKAEDCERRCLVPSSTPATHHLMRVEQGEDYTLFLLIASKRNDRRRYLWEAVASTRPRAPVRHIAAMQALSEGLSAGRVRESCSIDSRLLRLERMRETEFERRIGCDLLNPAIARAYFAAWERYLPAASGTASFLGIGFPPKRDGASTVELT